MVQRLIGEGLLRSSEVIAALRKVPRELFVSDELRPYAYNDTPLPTHRGQTISAPHGMRSRAIHGGNNE
jgi:protein-L-isoaspartate(D-aspartate) O-methyltransferase